MVTDGGVEPPSFLLTLQPNKETHPLDADTPLREHPHSRPRFNRH